MTSNLRQLLSAAAGRMAALLPGGRVKTIAVQCVDCLRWVPLRRHDQALGTCRECSVAAVEKARAWIRGGRA